MRKFTLLVAVILMITFTASWAELYQVIFNAKVYITNTLTPAKKGTKIQVRNAAGLNYTQGDSMAVRNDLGDVTVTALGDDSDPSTPYVSGFHLSEKIYFYISDKLAKTQCETGNDSCDYYRNPKSAYEPTFGIKITIILDTTRPKGSFQGSLQLNNQPAPVGTLLKAYDPTGAVLYGQVIVSAIGTFSIEFTPDDPATPGTKEGPVDGESIMFKINDAVATIVSGSSIFTPGQIKNLNLSVITQQTLCTFIGVTCKLNGASIGATTQIKAYNRWGNLCGDTLGSSMTPGYFLMRINKELGQHDGALNGDTLIVKFNNVQAFPTAFSPSKLMCVEGDNNLIAFLEAQIDTTIDTSFLAMVVKGTIYSLSGSAPHFGLTAYTVNDKVVGRAYADQVGQFRILIGGDNPATPTKIEGCVPSDTIMFKAVLPPDAKPTQVTTPRPLTYTYSDSISGVVLFFLNVGTGETPGLNQTSMRLQPNIPNPFNPTTDLPFQIAENSQVSLNVYNVLGECVRNIYYGQLAGGDYVMSWDGKDQAGTIQPAGVYFVCLDNGRSRQVRKICLMK